MDLEKNLITYSSQFPIPVKTKKAKWWPKLVVVQFVSSLLNLTQLNKYILNIFHVQGIDKHDCLM